MGSWVPTLLLVGSSWLLLLSAMRLHSPLIAAISMLMLLAAVFREIGRRWQISYLWGIWALLLLVLPLPLGLDRVLITKLQLASSWLSSVVLDGVGVLHLMEGNALYLPGKQLFVDEACSGIISILSIVAAAAIVGVWWNRPPLYVLLLSVSGVAWATLLNVVRISLIAYCYDQFGLDWSVGFPHELLSLVLFGVTFVALLSTDQLLKAWIGPVTDAWEGWAGSPLVYGRLYGRVWDAIVRGPAEVVPPIAEPIAGTAQVSAGPALGELKWLLPIGCIAFSALAAMQWVWWPSERLVAEVDPNTPVYLAAYSLDQQSLPEEMADARLLTHHTEERNTDHELGRCSKVYQYADVENRALTVSCDFVFPNSWHELTVCYKGIGWTMETRSVVPLEVGQQDDVSAVKAFFHCPDGQYAIVLFCEFDQSGKALLPPELSFRESLTKVFTRRDEFDSREVIQVQVLLKSPIPLSEERIAQGLRLLADARQQFRQQIVSQRKVD